jgi:glycosyltransferase involved in cell wall biosynthesis
MLSLASVDARDTIDVLVVDDGSQIAVIDEAAVTTSFNGMGSVKFIYLETNKGIEYALNTGLEYIESTGAYKFIARLDTGDFCIGKRFTIQQNFLEQHPKIKLVGTNAISVDTQGQFLFNLKMPATADVIRKRMFLNCMFIHPTVMFCSDILPETGYYPVNRKSAEDYAFFFKIERKFETANLQEFLVKLEINPSGISMTKRKQQVASRMKVILDNFYFGFYPIYGLLRSALLYVIPNSLVMFLKRIKG